jgi:hypothetical protein
MRRLTTIGLALVLAAAGCAGQTGEQRDAGSPVINPSWESCDAALPPPPSEGLSFPGGDALGLPRLDDSFQPVAAVVCRRGELHRSGGGTDETAVEARADDIAGLLPALKLPDEKPTDGACTADLVLPPWLVLLDAQGRWIRPGVPFDLCGKPRQEFREAVDRLSFRETSSRPIAEIQSDAAAAAGCEQRWADMVWAVGDSGPVRDNGIPALAADDAAVKICRYRVPKSEQGSAKPAGGFDSGGMLAATRWTAVKRELAKAGPAATCTKPASRFAVLHPPSGGDIYAELDSCRRIWFDTGALRQGTASLVALIGS